MIVSHYHRFIFIAVPKTATHAVRRALRSQLHADDWEQVELYHKSRIPLHEFQDLTHGHITSREAKKVLGDEIWNSYYKFAFVRNPFDRFISYAFYRNTESSLFNENKLAMMKLIFQKPNLDLDVLFQPQLDFIYDTNGELMVNDLGRFEELQNSFDRICKKISLNKMDLKKCNVTKHKLYRNYYDEELKQQVADYYQKDLQKLDYSF